MQLYKKFNPLVSIILPAFNRAALLPRAIGSVFQQTEKNFELIVIDDGSTDNTFDVINSYIKSNENIRYVKQQNMKLPIALNVGIKLSAGKYITFLGSDDEYKPEHIRLRAEYLERHPGTDLLHGGVEIVGNKFVKDKNDLSKMIKIEDCAVGGTFFGKREVFIELNGFKDIPYSEDSEFLERAGKMFKIEKYDKHKTYVYYRDSEDSICNTI